MNLEKEGKRTEPNKREENKGEWCTTKKRETKSLQEGTVNNIKCCSKRGLKTGAKELGQNS